MYRDRRFLVLRPDKRPTGDFGRRHTARNSFRKLNRVGRVLKVFCLVQCSSQPEFCFMQRASGDLDKSLVILYSSPAASFCYICTHTVSRPDQLHTDGIFFKIIPGCNNIPNHISQFLSQLVNLQILKPLKSHNSLIFSFFSKHSSSKH